MSSTNTSASGKVGEDITSTSNTTKHQKYRGLLKRKSLNIFRDDLFRFFNYLYTIAPSHLSIVTIMKYLHFIQIAVLAFFPFSSILWTDKSLLCRISQVFSVVSTIVPSKVNISIHLLFEIIIYLLYFSFVVFFLSCFKLFKVYTKINTISIKLITVIMNAFFPYLITLTSSNLGLDLFLIVTHNKIGSSNNTNNYYYMHTDYNYILVLFNFILGWIELISMISFQLFFVTPSLTFRPQAIHILSPSVSLTYFFFIFYFSFSTTFGSIYEDYKGYLSICLIFICVIPIGFLIYNLYIHYEIFVTDKLHQILLSLFHMIIANLFVLLTIVQLKQNISEIAIFFLILVFFVSYYIIPYAIASSKNRNIQILNKIEENESILKKVSKNRYLQLLRIGFDSGHPICHTWKLFKMADSNMVKDKTFLFIFAHYAAIYPDESIMLHTVYKLIQKVKHNSVELKYLMFQINNLLQQRERGLSKTIKKTCTKIADKTEKCRYQLRLVWQSVINGSTSELDRMTQQLKKNEDEIEREYSQLCFVYPNNPYIASSYSAFLSDIMCDDTKSEEYAQIYKQLRSGARTIVERSYYFATMMIKTLPNFNHHLQLNNDKNKSGNTNNDNRSSCTSMALGNQMVSSKHENINDAQAQEKYIEMLIDSVKLPSIRYGPILLFFVVSLIFPILSIPLLSQMNLHLENNMVCIYIMELYSLLRTRLCQLSMTSFYYTLSKNHFVVPLSSINTNNNGLWGETASDETIFLASVGDCVYALNLLNVYFPKISETKIYPSVLPFLNSPNIDFDVYSSMTEKTEAMWSLQHVSSFIGLTAVELSNKKNYQMLRFPDLRTITTNCVNILIQSRNAVNSFIDYFLLMNNEIYDKFLLCVVGVGGGILISGIILIVFIFLKMNQEKNLVYDSFKTLPKSTISSIVDKIDAQSGKRVEQDSATQALSFQEQSTMRIFNLSSDQRTHINEEILFIVILLLISIIFIVATMIFSIFTQKAISSKFTQMSSTIFDFTRIHSTFFTILLIEMRIASMNNENLNASFPENYSLLINQCFEVLNDQYSNFVFMRFGREFIKQGGLSSIGNDVIYLLTNSLAYEDEKPDNISEILSRISFENKIFSIYDVLYQIYVELLFQQPNSDDENSENSANFVNVDDYRFTFVLNYLINEENHTFLDEGLTFVHQKMQNFYNKFKSEYLYFPIAIADIIIIIIGLIVVFKFIDISKRAQWAMRLLLFCPSNIVFQSQTISKLLSNDFSKSENDENEESSQFYEKVSANIPYPVIFLDSEMNINSVNNSFCRIFKKSISDIRNQPLNEILNNSSFSNAAENILNEKRPPAYRGEIDIEVDGEVFNFDVSLIAVNTNGKIQKQIVPIDYISMFALTMVNITESVRNSETYQKEQESIRKLLSASIPEHLLDQHIFTTTESRLIEQSQYSSYIQQSSSLFSNTCSFSIKNASIIVAEIIGIQSAPSVSPSEFIEKLDSLYESLNAILANYGELIKLSSLNGFLIAASGIINENASLQQQSKTSVAFGLDIIEELNKFNAQQNTSLSLKIGVNTGGPLTAGVLNMARPSFQIFGEAASLAMELERTAPIMKIHINQLVYEYVYGEGFSIKEFDDLSYQEQSMKTYIISGYEQ